MLLTSDRGEIYREWRGYLTAVFRLQESENLSNHNICDADTPDHKDQI